MTDTLIAIQVMTTLIDYLDKALAVDKSYFNKL